MGRSTWSGPHHRAGERRRTGAAADLIATLNLAVGDLNKIKRIVKWMVLVNNSPSFTEQHVVANGASEVLAEVFGDRGTTPAVPSV